MVAQAILCILCIQKVDCNVQKSPPLALILYCVSPFEYDTHISLYVLETQMEAVCSYSFT